MLTSCVLRYKPSPASLSEAMSSGGASSPVIPVNGNGRRSKKEPPPQERFISCCFSFTIQRDLHGIPTLIAGMCVSCLTVYVSSSRGSVADRCRVLHPGFGRQLYPSLIWRILAGCGRRRGEGCDCRVFAFHVYIYIAYM